MSISSLDRAYSLTTKDHYSIHGIINTPARLSGQVNIGKVVLLPVICEQDMHSHMAQSQRKYFNKNGYDVIRIALSHSAQDARAFDNITLGHMAEDLRQICEQLRIYYKNIHIMAHGLVAFAAALSNADCDGQSLIEPCFVPYENFVESGYSYRRELGVYQNLINPLSYLSPSLVESCKLFDHQSCRYMIESIDRPTQFIWAQYGFGENFSQLYKAYLNTHAESVIIEHADHNFQIADTIDRVAEKGLEWFSYCGHMYDLSAMGMLGAAPASMHKSVN